LSQWGLVNAITRTSQDVTDYDRATELERLGGVVLDMAQYCSVKEKGQPSQG
jgi:hypothetical protein